METMAITDALEQIQSWYRQYYADSFIMAMAMASYLYLFAHKEKERKRFLYPIALIALCVLNPVLYALAYYQVIYWRLFWMLPDALLIAYAVTKLVKENRKMADKALVLAMALLLLVTFGSNVYQKESFTKIQNPEKVDRAVKEVCDVMLGLEDSPKCILPAPLLSQARQYSGEIRSMYGRNMDGYILGVNDEQWRMYITMESEQPDFEYIFSRAAELGYEFVVTYGEHEVGGDVVERNCYRELEPAGGYRIFYSGGEKGNHKADYSSSLSGISSHDGCSLSGMKSEWKELLFKIINGDKNENMFGRLFWRTFNTFIYAETLLAEKRTFLGNF